MVSWEVGDSTPDKVGDSTPDKVGDSTPDKVGDSTPDKVGAGTRANGEVWSVSSKASTTHSHTRIVCFMHDKTPWPSMAARHPSSNAVYKLQPFTQNISLCEIAYPPPPPYMLCCMYGHLHIKIFIVCVVL